MTPRIDRPTARLVVVDETGHVLLFRIVDPRDPTKPPCWITPGGAIEPGESRVDAAARELREETGVAVDPADLGRPIAVCEGDWVFRGTPLHSTDWYFGLRTARFEPSDDGLDEVEQELHVAFRWWHPDDVEAPDEAIYPKGLAGLARSVARGDTPATPVELPWS